MPQMADAPRMGIPSCPECGGRGWVALRQGTPGICPPCNIVLQVALAMYQRRPALPAELEWEKSIKDASGGDALGVAQCARRSRDSALAFLAGFSQADPANDGAPVDAAIASGVVTVSGGGAVWVHTVDDAPTETGYVVAAVLHADSDATNRFYVHIRPSRPEPDDPPQGLIAEVGGPESDWQTGQRVRFSRAGNGTAENVRRVRASRNATPEHVVETIIDESFDDDY